MHGIINLDKPAGLTSARAVARVKALVPRGTKVGHAGTLDPFATGVLLILVGTATRTCESLMDQPKEYLADVQLGATTQTDDCDSPPQPVLGAMPVTPEAVQAKLKLFIGMIRQRPPTFSALKVGGRRAYAIARSGEAVELAERVVRVDDIELLSLSWPTLRLAIRCGRGTYIRAIARDLGQKLGCGGYLSALRRTRIGPFFASAGVALADLSTANIQNHLESAEVVLHPPAPAPYNPTFERNT